MNNPYVHFNKLTAAELERLAVLFEEMGEAIQVVGKIVRHGYESENPLLANATPNRELLEKELGDVLHAIDRLFDAGDIRRDWVEIRRDRKAETIKQWLHHQQRAEAKADA